MNLRTRKRCRRTAHRERKSRANSKESRAAARCSCARQSSYRRAEIRRIERSFDFSFVIDLGDAFRPPACIADDELEWRHVQCAYERIWFRGGIRPVLISAI